MAPNPRVAMNVPAMSKVTFTASHETTATSVGSARAGTVSAAASGA